MAKAFRTRDNFRAWPEKNRAKVRELIEEKRMRPPGLAAFEARAATAVAPYSFENRHVALDPAFEKTLRANKKAWEFFQSQAPWYRRTLAFWIMDAKREPIPLLKRTK